MEFRDARREDLPAIVALLIDEDSTQPMPSAVDDRYRAAFAAVDRDPHNEMIVGEDEGEVVAYLQVTYIPGLGGHGRDRAHVEAVRVRADRRGRGSGRELMSFVIERAHQRGCTLVQLMSNTRRSDAHRFTARSGSSRVTRA